MKDLFFAVRKTYVFHFNVKFFYRLITARCIQCLLFKKPCNSVARFFTARKINKINKENHNGLIHAHRHNQKCNVEKGIKLQRNCKESTEQNRKNNSKIQHCPSCNTERGGSFCFNFYCIFFLIIQSFL